MSNICKLRELVHSYKTDELTKRLSEAFRKSDVAMAIVIIEELHDRCQDNLVIDSIVGAALIHPSQFSVILASAMTKFDKTTLLYACGKYVCDHRKWPKTPTDLKTP